MDGILAFLSTPDFGNGIADFEEGEGREDRTSEEIISAGIRMICEAAGGAHIGKVVDDLAVAVDSKGSFPRLANLAPMV